MIDRPIISGACAVCLAAHHATFAWAPTVVNHRVASTGQQHALRRYDGEGLRDAAGRARELIGRNLLAENPPKVQDSD